MNAPAPQQWTVPVEVVVALASPTHQALINRRRAMGDRPKPDALIFARAGELWGVLSFHGGDRLDLQIRVSAPLWENAG